MKGNSAFKYPAFFLASSHHEADGGKILKGIEKVFGKDVNAFVDNTGDDFPSTEIVFTNYSVSNNGMVCIAINEEKVAVSGTATCRNLEMHNLTCYVALKEK